MVYLQAPSRARRRAAMLAATAGIGLLTVACGGNSSSTASGGSSASADSGGTAVAYSQCIRSHGVPKYPDPASGGGVAKTDAQHLGVSESVLQAAQRACQHLLPVSGSQRQQEQQCLEADSCTPAQVQQIESTERKFAGCMRSHGVPNWPDPTLDDTGRPVFNLIPVGISHAEQHSPSMTATIAECQRLDPTAMGIESN